MSTPTIELEATQENWEHLVQIITAFEVAGISDDDPSLRFVERLEKQLALSLALQRLRANRQVAA